MATLDAAGHRHARARSTAGPSIADRPVIEAMSTPALSVPADLSLAEALHRMVRTGCRHLAVVDRAGRCVGVLADRTIVAAWAYEPTALSGRAVGTVLDLEPATLTVTARVLDAARLMRTAGVDAVAVVDDDGCPVGVLTGGDLVALLAT